MPEPYLIGAYGMFWDRQSVDWTPGSGSAAWQLLGRVGLNSPKLRVCDFRTTQGFYVLFDDHGANYVGLARGSEGIGARLKAHNASGKTWSRFCWFSFDSVEDDVLTGWSRVKSRDAVRNLPGETVLRECEALLIQVLGSARVLKWVDSLDGQKSVKSQNEMRFLSAELWHQLREQDFQPGEVARRVDSNGYTDGWLKSLTQLD